jgi:LuxR family maltose regulon positive regulatory protein
LDLASGQGKRRILFAGQPHIYIGSILREWNELEAAMTHLIEGIELCEPTRLLDALTDGYLAMARVHQGQGDLSGAIDAFHNAQQTLKVPNPEPVSLIRADDCQVRLWLAQGMYQAAARWVEESGLKVDDELSYVRELEHISLARALVALGRAQPGGSHIDDAQNLLARLQEAAETAGWMGKAVEILVLQALALNVQGEKEEALAALERALSLAEPEGYVRTFVDEGAPMAALLSQAASRSIAPDYVGKLLAAFEIETKDRGRNLGPARSAGTMEPSPSTLVLRPSSRLVEPLSNRELEVLRLLDTDLTAPEIAGELVVSVNTVKTHIKRIYSKLDAHSRYEAVERAKELGFL